MKKRISWAARRKLAPARKRRRLHAPPFSAPEPAIVAGKFKGQKLSALSNEDLTSFLKWDAQFQTIVNTPNIPSSFFANLPKPDFSQYWFAKYELERRRKVAEGEPTSSIKLTAEDTSASIAWRLVDYAYRAASRKHHPDAGGDTRSMQRLNAARDYARARLKQ